MSAKSDPLETSQAELEELERAPRPPKRLSHFLQVLKTRKRDAGPPRDEIGRFAKKEMKPARLKPAAKRATK